MENHFHTRSWAASGEDKFITPIHISINKTKFNMFNIINESWDLVDIEKYKDLANKRSIKCAKEIGKILYDKVGFQLMQKAMDELIRLRSVGYYFVSAW